jgi:hypothetical protein
MGSDNIVPSVNEEAEDDDQCRNDPGPKPIAGRRRGDGGQSVHVIELSGSRERHGSSGPLAALQFRQRNYYETASGIC